METTRLLHVLDAQGPPRLWIPGKPSGRGDEGRGQNGNTHVNKRFPRPGGGCSLALLCRAPCPWLPNDLLRNVTLHPKVVSKTLQMAKDRRVERSSRGRSTRLSTKPGGGRRRHMANAARWVFNPHVEGFLPKEPAQIRAMKQPSWNGQLLKFTQAGLKIRGEKERVSNWKKAKQVRKKPMMKSWKRKDLISTGDRRVRTRTTRFR